MGARTSFIQAMLIGVVVGAAIATAYFQLRGDDKQLSVAAKPVSGSAGSSASPAIPDSATARSVEIARLRQRIGELERANAAGSGARSFEPDAESGMSTDEAWWQALPPNPAWDGAREQKMIERLAKLGVTLDPKNIECKTRCCRFDLDEETKDEHWDDIQSSVGIDFEMPDGLAMAKAGDSFQITKCWSKKPTEKPFPDRLAEREALLAKAADELKRCGANISPAITLKLRLSIDPDGQISKVESNAKQLGQKAATCAETALLQAASFAAGPTSTEVPLTVQLGK